MAVSKGKEVAASTPASTSSSSKRKKAPPKPPSGKKTRRSGVLQFIDDVADDASDSESDGLSFLDSGDDEVDGEIAGFDIKPGLKDTMLNLPFFLKEEDLSIEEQEQFVKQRYGKDSVHVVFHEDIKISRDKKFNLQSMKGPPVWKVKCSVGCERQIAFCLFQKFVDVRSLGSGLPLISVFAIDHVKGHVFIEAEKESDCIEASRGLCKIYSSRLVLVSKEEISRLLSVRKTSSELSEGTWVRIKNGRYRGDLAQVMAFDNGKKRAMVKLVPRIDLQAMAKKFGGGESLKHSAIPSPRLISSRELEDFRPHIQIKKDRLTGEYFDVLDGLLLKDGYLYKKLSIGSLSCMGIQPTNDELVKFEVVKKNGQEDISWLSLVYGGRKRGRSLGESGDCLETGGRNSSCEVHDLVLFGRKSFGVVIGIKGDCIQILKGDVEESSEVVTIQRKEIRSTCIDKVFTASDYNKKTIYINDIIRVLEGPLEGKEGLVRHMYKGTLFVYNETQTDNCGFLCVKSQLCKNIKQSKGTKSDKISSSSTPANVESTNSVGLVESESSLRRPPRMEKDQPFSIGQILRIRVGPLKGYICRVVSLYRSNATVKLDSLVKVITVDLKDLSEVKTRSYGSRDSSATTLGNQFVSPEKPTDDVWGAPLDGSSWNLELPSISRGSWLDYSASTFSIPGPIENRMGIDGVMDQWSSKLRSQEGDQAIQPNEGGGCWDKAVVSGGGLSSSWDITGGSKDETGNWENDSSTWKKNIPSTSSSGADTWEKSKLPCDNAGITWGEIPARDGDEKNPPAHVIDNWATGKHDNHMDSWSIPESNNCLKKVDTQNQAKKVHNEKSEGWRSSEADDHDPKNAWNAKGKSIDNEGDTWQKASTPQSKESINNDDRGWKRVSQSTDLCASQAYSDGQPNQWEAKVKSISETESDAWGKVASRVKTDIVDDSKSWGKTSQESKGNNSVLDSWNQAEGLHVSGSHAISSNTGVDGSNKWDKLVATPHNSLSDPIPSGGWGQISDKWTAPTSAHCATDGWENTKASSGRVSDLREKAKVAGEGKTNCWLTSGIPSHGKDDSWAQGESSSGWKQGGGHGQPSGCNSWSAPKSDYGGQTGCWRKEKPSTGAHSDSSDCFKCGQPGHLARECPSAGGNDGGRSSDCYKCGKPGHFARECPSADHSGTRQSSCYKCGQPGHFSRECPSADGIGAAKRSDCFRCGQPGHLARDCPSGDGNGAANRSDCFKCGQSGHLARECPSAGGNDGGRSSDCFKCGQPGHFARECSSADGSGVAKSSDCYKCGQPGHFARDCPSAVGSGGSRSSGCYKCGEAGHFARECTSSSGGDGNKSSRSTFDGDGSSGKGWGNQFERSSQRGICTSDFSDHNLSDTKSDKIQGWDQWDSKPKMLDGEKSTQLNEKDCWDKKRVSSTSSNINSGLRKQAGSWGNDSGGCSGEIDAWEKAKLPNDDSGRTWRDNSGDRKRENPCANVNDAQHQNNGDNKSGSRNIPNPSEWSKGLNSKAGGKEYGREQSGYWNISQASSHNSHNSWNAKGETAGSNVDDAWQKNSASQSKEDWNNGKQVWEEIISGRGSCLSQPISNDQPNSWDVKGGNVSGNQAWGNSSSGPNDNNTSFDMMGKNTFGNDATDVWGKASSQDKAVGGDDKGKTSGGSHGNSSWDLKGENAAVNEADVCCKRDCGGGGLHTSGGHTVSSMNVDESNQSGKFFAISRWSQSEKLEKTNINTSSNSSKSLDWGQGSEQGAEPTSSRNPTDSWGNSKSSTGCPVEKWEKSKAEAGGETGGWQKSGTPRPDKEDSWIQRGSSGSWKQGGSQGQSSATDVWAAAKTTYRGESVSWEKARAPTGDHSGSWSRAKDPNVGESCRSMAPSSGRSDCFKCGQPGHFARECPSADGSGRTRGSDCYKCGQPGHIARECPSADGSGRTRGSDCYKCGKPGHIARECPSADGSGRTRGSDCYKCGQPGHIARECPSADGSGRTRGSDCYKCGLPGHIARECPSADGGDRSMLSSRSNFGAASGSRGSWSGGSEQAWP